MNLEKLFQKAKTFYESPSGKTIAKYTRLLFVFGIIAFLIFQLSQIGFSKLWQNLPTHPLFYILLVVLYFTLPITEQFIYRLSLKFDFWSGFKIFTKKKVLNQEVIGYSGEAYFLFWANKNLEESSKKILGVVKDNTIISALASTLTAVILLSVFFFSFNNSGLENTIFETKNLLIGGGFMSVLLILFFSFRNKILSVDKKTAWLMFGIHELRICWVYTLEILQWIIVLPAVPILIWFTFLSVKIISSRIPLLPNRDLIFISASLEVSKFVEIGEAEIAGILLTSTVLTKVMNLIFFSLFSFNNKGVENENLNHNS